MTEVLVILLLIALNGVFAMSEIAVISARKSRLEAEAKRGSRAARRALRLANEPDRFLSTIQIGITLVGILTGIYSGARLSGYFAGFLSDVCGVPERYADEVAQVSIVVVVTYLTLIFGELFPKRIGMNAAEKVSKAVARPMHALSVVASPFVWLLAKSTSLIFRLSGLRQEGEKVTEQDIRSLLEAGKADGAVLDVEHDIVERVLLMGDRTVESLMTHRSEVVMLDRDATAEEVRSALSSRLYQVYPVADGSGGVMGVVRLKELFLNLDRQDFALLGLCVPATVFHEGMTAYAALERMRRAQVNTALVFDEFGTFQGVVSLKDILEGLVGHLGDDTGKPEEIAAMAEGRGWIVDGRCPLCDFLHYFGADELLGECGQVSTVGGLVLHCMERIPVCGDSVVWHMFEMEVSGMDGARIVELLVRRVDREG